MNKKILALGLSAVVVSGLVACGGDGGKEETNTSEKAAFVYVPEYFEWDLEEPENGYTNTYGAVNGYMLGLQRKWDNETGESTQEIIKYNIADNNLELIPYVSEDEEEYINNITLKPDGSIVACMEKYTWDESTMTGSSSYRVITLDEAGQITGTVDLSALCEEMADKYDYVYINNLTVDAEDTIYVAFEQEVVALNPDGSKLFSVETESWIQNMGNMPDGSAYVVYYGNEGGCKLSVLDKTAQGLGTKYDLGNYNLNGFFNVAEDNTLYFSDSTAMRKMNLESGECEELFSWLSVDINGQYIDGVNYIDENTIYAYYRDWSTDEESFVKLVKTDSSLVKEKITLVVASLTSDSNIQEDIVAFNKANDTYRMELKTYLDYNSMSDADWENYDQFLSDATTRMLNDITGTNPPDIISVSDNSISLTTLANKGVLEELTPYLEKAGYKESDFMAGVVNSYKVNDKLYALPGRFALQTVLADSAIVGDKQGWTVQEALEVIKNLPEGMSFSEYDTQEYFIQKCLMFGYTTFVDEQNATCNFESEEFKAVLEMAKTFPAEYTWDEDAPSTPMQIQNGSILTMDTVISSLEDIQLNDAYFGDKKVTYIGYPGVAGNGSLLYAYGSNYAICSKSEYKDMAAEFVIAQITEPYDPEGWDSWGFPTLIQEFEAYVKEQTTVEYVTDENGELILDEEGNPIPEGSGGGIGWGDWEYTYRQCTEEDAQVLIDLVNGVEDTYTGSNNTIYSMIMEEVTPYLSGQKTVDEVASIIQNRINLYLIENN